MSDRPDFKFPVVQSRGLFGQGADQYEYVIGCKHVDGDRHPKCSCNITVDELDDLAYPPPKAEGDTTIDDISKAHPGWYGAKCRVHPNGKVEAHVDGEWKHVGYVPMPKAEGT